MSKCLQRGEDSNFDQLLIAFGNVAEQCLPSLLRTLFAWYARQGVSEWGSQDNKYKQDPNKKGFVLTSFNYHHHFDNLFLDLILGVQE